MTDFIISTIAGAYDNTDNPAPAPSVLFKQYNDGINREAYLYNGTDVTDWASARVIGAWDEATGLQDGQTYDEDNNVIGTPKYLVHPDYADYIRPFENDDGVATGALDSIRWAGHPEQKFLEADNRYPSSNRPFTIRIKRAFFEDNPQGHGFIATMITDDPNRNIATRRMTVYTDDTFSQVDYSTGTFNNGDATPPKGQRTLQPQPLYFVLTDGPNEEGRWQLLDLSDGAEVSRLFWAS